MPNRIKNLTGQKFKSLTALNPTEKRTNHGSVVWRCRCECGNIVFVAGYHLARGDYKSCGCMPRTTIDLSGRRFGRLLVLHKEPTPGPRRYYQYTCKCDCGKIVLVDSSNLGRTTKSCGCLAKELSAKRQRKNITGQRFGRLIAIKPTKRRYNRLGGVIWECLCDCGDASYVVTRNLLSGGTKSCGCLYYASQFVKGMGINPMDVPIEITDCMKARGELKRAIKEVASK